MELTKEVLIMGDNHMDGGNFIALGQRVGRIKTAVALGIPDRVPVTPFFDGVITRLTGGSYADHFYDHQKAGNCAIAFVQKYPNVDAACIPQFFSGVANELAGTRIIDWPGRPGTSVDRYSTHQIHEIAFMEQEEYPELLSDYTGFMLRKYIPRAFPNIQGTQNIVFAEGSTFTPGREYTLISGASGLDKDKFSLPGGDRGSLKVVENTLVYTAPKYFYIKIAENLPDVAIPLQWAIDNGIVTEETDSATGAAVLSATGENGIAKWQSYCLGLDPNEAESVVLCEAAAEQPGSGCIAIKAGNIDIPAELEGARVSATLERMLPGGDFESVTNGTFSSGAIVLTTPEIGPGISFFA